MVFPQNTPIPNIRTRLLLFVLLPFLAIIIAIGWYGLRALEATAKAGMEQDIQLIARTIRLPLSHALQHGHNATLQRTVTSAFDMDQVYGVYVYDQDGKRVSAIGTRDAEVQGRKAAILASIGDEQGSFEDVGGEEVFSYFMPLTDNGGNIIGLLQVTRRGSDFAHHLDQFRWRALSMVIAASLLVIIVIWVGYHRALGRHIHTMGLGMARMAEGDIQHRLPTTGPSEIRALSLGINTLLDSVQASEKELENRRQRELELTSRLHQSEKLAAIGRFAAGVAHELGTPLSVADGQAQRALRKATPESAEAFSAIRQQLRRMERIIRQLMNFARPVVPEKREVKIADLAHACLQQVAEESARNHTPIQVHAPATDIVLRADRLRLEQALINLLRNALQATPGGQVQLSWGLHPDHQSFIRVEDNGPGVAEEHRTHLLEPFFTTKSIGQGTGLGLAIVDAVVNEHGGRIELERSPLGGASFTLYLPLEGNREETHHA